MTTLVIIAWIIIIFWLLDKYFKYLTEKTFEALALTISLFLIPYLISLITDNIFLISLPASIIFLIILGKILDY